MWSSFTENKGAGLFGYLQAETDCASALIGMDVRRKPYDCINALLCANKPL